MATQGDIRSQPHLQRESARPYHGVDMTPALLEAYLTRCWREFCEGFPVYSYPCTTIVQSSGFGKSHLLRDLAVHTLAATANAHMIVLYVCVRDDADESSSSSSDYPVTTTTQLRDYLFTPRHSTTGSSSIPVVNHEQELASRLCHVFDKAIACWSVVGHERLRLFTDGDHADDASVVASFPDANEQVGCPTPSTEPQFDNESTRRIVVLAIDDARALLPVCGRESSSNTEIGHVALLHRALRLAYQRIMIKYGKYAGIFAVFADTTTATVPLAVPPRRSDGSSRGRGDQRMVFAPFVLTHTMDIHFDSLILAHQPATQQSYDLCSYYQDLVCSQSQSSHEEYLASMGRPLWKSRLAALRFDGVIQLAATKLLNGVTPWLKANLNEATLYGVSSILCRVGLRPSVSSPFASRLVADFMAVLSYVSMPTDYQKDHAWTWTFASYASEPILAFGASRVWYQAAREDDHLEMLGERILPQLRKLVLFKLVETDSGDLSDLAARVLLLLAMDTLGAMETGRKSGRHNNGAFRSVWDFLEVLSGTSPIEVRDVFGQNKTAETMEELRVFQDTWSEWKIGFSHFVQLSQEPTIEDLWAMLARRAAGVLPQNYKGGVDLLLPIFRGEEPPQVSMVLIHVASRVDGDPAFLHSVSMTMHPRVVFTGDLKELSETQVVRVYLNLRTSVQPQQFYLIDYPEVRQRPRNRPQESKEEETPSTFVLCYDGLAVSNAQRGDQPIVQFLSTRVVSELTKLMELASWQPAKLIQAHLETHTGSNTEAAAASALVEATRPLVTSLVSTKWRRLHTEQQIQTVNAKAVRTRSDGLEDVAVDSSVSPPHKCARSM